MNAPFAQALLHVDEAIAEQIRVLDGAAFGRFVAASRFAERALGGSLREVTGGLSFFVEHEGMNLVIKFCRTRELFMIKSFVDLNDDLDPVPPGGAARGATVVERLLNAVGAGPTLRGSDDGNDDLMRLGEKQISYCQRSPFDRLELPLPGGVGPTSTHAKSAPNAIPAAVLFVPTPSDFRVIGTRRSARLVLGFSVTASEEECVTRSRGSGPPTVP